MFSPDQQSLATAQAVLSAARFQLRLSWVIPLILIALLTGVLLFLRVGAGGPPGQNSELPFYLKDPAMLLYLATALALGLGFLLWRHYVLGGAVGYYEQLLLAGEYFDEVVSEGTSNRLHAYSQGIFPGKPPKLVGVKPLSQERKALVLLRSLSYFTRDDNQVYLPPALAAAQIAACTVAVTHCCLMFLLSGMALPLYGDIAVKQSLDLLLFGAQLSALLAQLAAFYIVAIGILAQAASHLAMAQLLGVKAPPAAQLTAER